MHGTYRRRLLLVIFSAVLLAGCGGEDHVTVVKLGHGLDVSHPVHQGMVFMADRVAEASGGRMRIDIYPSQQLGSEREMLELLQIGSLGMTKVSSAVLEAFVPEFQVFGLPYLFRDDAHKFAVLEGPIGRDILLSAAPYNLRGLTYYDSGSRSFYTKDRPIREPADLRGLKIRTQESPLALRMVEQLGGSATPIAWGELYTALQQGIVDGAENNPPSFYSSRHYEIARYYTLDEHTSVPDVLLVSTIVWDALSAQEQAWLQEAATASLAYQKQLWQEAVAASLAAVEEAGVTIIRPPKEPFAEQVAPMYDQYRADPRVGSLIERIQAAP